MEENQENVTTVDEFHLPPKATSRCFEILKKYPATNVFWFLIYLNFTRYEMLKVLKTPKKSHLIEDLNPVKSSIEKTINHLRKIEKGDLSFYSYFYGYSPDGLETEEVINMEIHARQEARIAVDSLTNIIELMGTSPFLNQGEKGKSKIDELKHGFAIKIAEQFENFLGEPTQYEYGEFYKIVQVYFKSVGLPHKAPRRSVKIAIKSLQS